jgi:hypothetical protein
MQPRYVRREQWKAAGKAWAPIAFLVVAVAASGYFVFISNGATSFLRACMVSPKAAEVTRVASTAPSQSTAPGKPSEISGSKDENEPARAVDCVVGGTAYVTAIAVGTFALVMLGWWMLTGLTGLKRIFEISWAGIDDRDVDSVGTLESVGRAGATLFLLLAGVVVAGASVSGVLHGNIGWFRSPAAAAPKSEPPKPNPLLVVLAAAQQEEPMPVPQQVQPGYRAIADAIDNQTTRQQSGRRRSCIARRWKCSVSINCSS